MHPISYSKFIQYEDLPDASGWEDDDLVRKTCGPNWCKDAPDLVVSKALEEAIRAQKIRLGYKETYDKDPYLQEMVLRSLRMVSIFGCNKPLDLQCNRRRIWYQDKLWKSSVRIFGKCSFDRDFLNSHDKIAKYLRRYTEPFEVPDNVVKQFPIKEIKSNQNKGWVVIPKEIKSCICQIADKIKGVTIRSIMPCIVNNPNAHLLSVHGDNKKKLVTNMPQDELFALDQRLLDYTSCVLFACQEEMYFGVGQRSSENDEALNQLQKFPLQCKLVFDNDDHQCNLGAFIKMCCEVLLPSAHEHLLSGVPKYAKNGQFEVILPKFLAEFRCGILKKEKNLIDNSTDAKNWIIDYAGRNQPFLVAIRGRFNTIGHCIGIVQNMIVDATLMDGIELSRDSLDAVLGEPVTEIIWCRTYYPSSDKVLPSLFIQSSTDIAHDKYVDSPVKTLSSQKELPSCQIPIQCKILFEDCKGQQVLGTCIKLVSEVLSPEAYAVLADKVRSMLRDSFVGIKICTRIVIDLQIGRFQKYKNFENIKIPIKQWIMEYAKNGQPFLFAVFCKKTKSEICIGITNDMIVESQLLGGIELNDCNLDFMLGEGNVRLMWCKTFYPHENKIKSGVALSTMQQLMKLGKS